MGYVEVSRFFLLMTNQTISVSSTPYSSLYSIQKSNIADTVHVYLDLASSFFSDCISISSAVYIGTFNPVASRGEVSQAWSVNAG